MGKQRYKRKKYHYSNETKEEVDNVSVKRIEEGVSGFKIDISENIFKDVNINIDEIEKNVMEVDSKEIDSKSVISVKSISKSIKSFKKSLGDIHLKKNDKRTLRRNLFLKKLQLSNINPNNKKKQKSGISSITEMDEHLPTVDMIFHRPKRTEESITKPKARGIMKAKARKKAFVNNMMEFKRIIQGSEFKSNPLNVITDVLEMKVFEENQ